MLPVGAALHVMRANAGGKYGRWQETLVWA